MLIPSLYQGTTLASRCMYQGTTLVVPYGAPAHTGALAPACPIHNRPQFDNLPHEGAAVSGPVQSP